MIPFDHSETFDKALAGFTHALSSGLAVVKSETADVKTYQYSYATLIDVLDVISRALAAKKCYVSQIPSGSPDAAVWTLTTTIFHESGEWIAFEPYTRTQVRDEQGFGSALTYARRYSLLAIFGIAPTDDDGAEATRIQRNESQYDDNRTAEELSIRTILKGLSAADRKEIVTQFKAHHRTDLAGLSTQRHADALQWVVTAIAHLPDPSESPSEEAPPVPPAGGASTS